MRGRFWLAVAALAAAFALLVPSVAPLSGSMDAFASDLANGTFRPFGSPGDRGDGAFGFTSSLGGLTGSSSGNFLPGSTELPQEWLMDRDGTPGAVTVDHVFNPSLGAMKRLKAYDRVDANGTTLEVADERLRTVESARLLQYDTLFTGRFDVRLRPGEPTPIYSPHPQATIQNAHLEQRIDGGFRILKDGSDTFYVVSDHDGVVTLNVTYRANSEYYFFDAAARFRVSDYPPADRPQVSEALREDAQVVLARAGVRDATDVTGTLQALADYFRAFEEGEIPEDDEVESLYLALAAGGKGCCRHRAFAFMVTAQAVGIPTRVVVNEAHAFVEVMMPTGRWHQINLGGCGTYTSNNPEGYPSLFEQAEDPRREANPDEGRPVVELPSLTEITDSPARIQKGESYFVNGTVVGLDGRPVPNAQVDVFLNETKDAPGRLTGAGRTLADGSFSVQARVPKDLPARGYQLVARSAEGGSGDVRFQESWSDPPVDVFAPTRFDVSRARAAVGVPVQIPGKLVDVDGNAVPGATVVWRAGGFEGTSRSDSQGRFVVNATFPQTGTASLGLSFAGDEHHGSASASVPVEVQPGAILLPPDPPVLARGVGGVVQGLVALAGADVADEPIRLELVGFSTTEGERVAEARTDPLGGFRLAVAPAAGTAPGVYGVTLEAPTLGLSTTVTVRVAIQPRLVLDPPTTVAADDPWVLEVALEADDGRRIADAPLEVRLDGASLRRMLTNSTGVARFELPAAALDAGAHDVTVRYAGDDVRLAAERSFAVEVVTPESLRLPGWALATILGGVLAVGALVWLVGARGPLRGLARRALAGGAFPERARLRLEFPDHPAGVVPACEPGGRERVRVVATRADGRPARMRVRVDLAGAGATLRTAARDGAADAEIDAPPNAGAHVLVASPRGLARLWTRPARAPMLVTSYREAVERAFVQLRDEARLPATATAGDVLRALAPRLGEDARTLREALALFDVADYSEAPIDRAAYHRFQEARLALARRLGGAVEASDA